MTKPGAHGPSVPRGTMPALLERPKLSNAMARALHRHIMMERERKRQGEPGRGGGPPSPAPWAQRRAAAAREEGWDGPPLVEGAAGRVRAPEDSGWEGPWRAPDIPLPVPWEEGSRGSSGTGRFPRSSISNVLVF